VLRYARQARYYGARYASLRRSCRDSAASAAPLDDYDISRFRLCHYFIALMTLLIAIIFYVTLRYDGHTLLMIIASRRYAAERYVT